MSVLVEGFLLMMWWDGSEGILQNLQRLRLLVGIFVFSALFVAYLVHGYFSKVREVDTRSKSNTPDSFPGDEPMFDVLTVSLHVDPVQVQHLPLRLKGPQLASLLDALEQARHSWSGIESTMLRTLPYDEADQRAEQFQPSPGILGHATVSMVFVSLLALPLINVGDAESLQLALGKIRSQNLRSFSAFVVR